MGTSLTAGQKYFFEQRLTWHPHTKQPSLGLWGEGEMEDPKIDEYNVKGKNVSAVHQLYWNIHRGITLTSKTILKKKSAIYVFLQTLPSQTLAHLLDFDDEESKYSGLRDINSKQHCGVNRQSQWSNPRPKAKGKKVLTTKPYGRGAVSEGRSASTRRVHGATALRESCNHFLGVIQWGWKLP